MKARGSVLLYALVALAIFFAAVIFLTHAARERVQAQTLAARREAALRAAEDLLEAGRSALAAGSLPSDGELRLPQGRVVCLASATGTRLEVLMPFTTSHPGRGVRVAWELSHLSSGGWMRSGWKAKDETIAP
jgi:hypothetical protein